MKILWGALAAALGMLLPLPAIAADRAATGDDVAIDWVISRESIDTSSVENEFVHQAKWDFKVVPDRLFLVVVDVVAEDGRKLAAKGQEFYSARGKTIIACTIEKGGSKAHLSARSNICVEDIDLDGKFDRAFSGKYRKDLQAVSLQDEIAIQPIRLQKAEPASASKVIDGRLWATAAIDHEVRLEFFVGKGPFMKWCDIPGGKEPGKAPVAFECGLPGLRIAIEDPSADRKARRLTINVPDKPVAIVFERTSVYFAAY